MPEIQTLVRQKVGPLPVWAYGVALVGGVGVFWYLRHRSASNAPTTGSAVDYAGGVPGPLGGASAPPPTDTSGGGTTATGPTLTDLMTGMASWFNQLLTAVNNLRPVTPPPTTPVVPSPSPTPTPVQPPTNGGGGGTPPSVTPTPSPTIPPLSLFQNYLVQIPTGQGIPQVDLRPGLLNLVQLYENIPVSHLQGWNAWYMNGGQWSEYDPTQSFSGFAVLAPIGVNPNTAQPWTQLQAAGAPANTHPAPVQVPAS